MIQPIAQPTEAVVLDGFAVVDGVVDPPTVAAFARAIERDVA